jgi:hypothetical protein
MTKKLTILNFFIRRTAKSDTPCTGNYIRNGQANEPTNQIKPIQSKTDQTREDQTRPDQTNHTTANN